MSPHATIMSVLLPLLLTPLCSARMMYSSDGSLSSSPITCPCTVSFSLLTLQKSAPVSPLQLFVTSTSRNTTHLVRTVTPYLLADRADRNDVKRFLHNDTFSVSRNGAFVVVAKAQYSLFNARNSVRFSATSSEHQSFEVCPIVLEPFPNSSLVPTLASRAADSNFKEANGNDQRLGEAMSVRQEDSARYSPIVGISRSGMTYCLGSLITSSWVLTAASCSVSIFSEVEFRSTSGPGNLMRFVRNVVLHNSTTDLLNDAALVELTRLAPIGAETVSLHTGKGPLMAGSFSREIGLSVAGNEYFIDLPVYLNEECAQRTSAVVPDELGLAISNGDSFVCAGYVEENECTGCEQKIAPVYAALVQYSENGEGIVQIGVSARQFCSNNLPSIFLHPRAILPWIQSMGVFPRESTSTQVVFANGSDEVAIIQDADRESRNPIPLIGGGIALFTAVIFLVAFLFAARKRKRRGNHAGSADEITLDNEIRSQPSQLSSLGQEELKTVLQLIEQMEDGEREQADTSMQRVEEPERISEDRIEPNVVQPNRRK